jgi:hypothetical protein
MADPELKMFRSDSPTTEIGTVGNPIDLGLCAAGAETQLPYDILLWNDKAGSLGSDDVTDIEIELLRLYVSQNWVSNGAVSQTFNTTYTPVTEDVVVEVTVDGTKWREVASFSGLGADDEVFTFNYTTGLLTFGNGTEGKIPANSLTIAITYTPDLNIFGKTIYSDRWLSIKSSGVIANVINISVEASTKIDNSTVQVLHYPKVNNVVGVWDNPAKTGTNYYTSGSFDENLGRLYLGTALGDGDNPYVEYGYVIKDDLETDYHELGPGATALLENRIPKNNAKRLQLKAIVPATAETEGGAYLKVVLRIYYKH